MGRFPAALDPDLFFNSVLDPISQVTALHSSFMPNHSEGTSTPIARSLDPDIPAWSRSWGHIRIHSLPRHRLKTLWIDSTRRSGPSPSNILGISRYYSTCEFDRAPATGAPTAACGNTTAVVSNIEDGIPHHGKASGKSGYNEPWMRTTKVRAKLRHCLKLGMPK